MTLGALGARQCTGQLTLQAEGKRYCIVFDHGAVVGAASPLAIDSAVRVALIHHLITPAQVAELTRRIAADSGREEIEVLAEAARLTLDQTVRLRRKVIEQRAARTFSVDQGEFVIDSNVAIPLISGLALDVRSVIYLGARMNLSELRLTNELRQLGIQFVLEPAAAGELEHFGFTEVERPILEALRAGTSVAELEAKHREIDPRTVEAAIYSLVSCGVCTGIVPPSHLSDASETAAANDFSVMRARGHTSPTPSDVYSRTRTGRDVFVSRAPTPSPRPATSRTVTPPPSSTPRTITPARAPAAAPDETGVPRAGAAARTRTAPTIARTRTPAPNSAPVGSGARLPSRSAPAAGRTPTPSGTPATGRATTQNHPSTGRAPTPSTGRTPTPGSAPAAGRTPTPTDGAAAGRTPTPLGLPVAGRTPTPLGMPRTRSPGAAATPDRGEAAIDAAAVAIEAYKRGLSRLRVENLEDAIVDLTRAVELQPNEVDYAAMLAWARFCHATDKQALAQATRDALGKAIRRSQSPETSRFYLGRVERMLGRDKEAMRHFQEVLEAQPRHVDAAAEIRAIEARMAHAAAKESGVFGRRR